MDIKLSLPPRTYDMLVSGARERGIEPHVWASVLITDALAEKVRPLRQSSGYAEVEADDDDDIAQLRAIVHRHMLPFLGE